MCSLFINEKSKIYFTNCSLYKIIDVLKLCITFQKIMNTKVEGGSGSKRQSQKELDYSERLRILDTELMSFYQYCQQADFTEAEMEVGHSM